MQGVTRRRRFLVLRGTLAVLALAGCGSSASPSAPAAPAAGVDTVTAIPTLAGESTTVILDAATLRLLAGIGARLTPTGEATYDPATREVAFPITAGYVEIHSDHRVRPGYVQGAVLHQGSGIALTVGTTQVTLADLVVDPGTSRVTGSVTVGAGPTQVGVVLLDLDGRRLEVSRPEGAVQLFGTVARLTAGAARALNAAFRTSAVPAGATLGVVRLRAGTLGLGTYPRADVAASIPRLAGRSTTVALDAGTVRALTRLGVQVTPLGSATASSGAAPALRFPITAGMVVVHTDRRYRPGFIAGVVDHAGSGLRFAAGRRVLEARDLVVDPGASLLTATVGGQVGVPLLDLDGRAVTVGAQGGDAVLTGTVARLTATAASALDATFGTDALRPGTPLGTVRLVAHPG